MRSTRSWARVAAGVSAVALGLALAPSAMAADTSRARAAPLINANAPDVIAGSYMVMLRAGADSVDAVAARTTAAGGTVSLRFSTISGFVAHLSSSALAAVRADSAVDEVESGLGAAGEVLVGEVEAGVDVIGVDALTGQAVVVLRVEQISAGRLGRGPRWRPSASCPSSPRPERWGRGALSGRPASRSPAPRPRR